jgi:DNA-directed RNA polymerase sigma subunit (sigma70/sigma32)
MQAPDIPFRRRVPRHCCRHACIGSGAKAKSGGVEHFMQQLLHLSQRITPKRTTSLMYTAAGQPDRDQLVQRFVPLVKRIAYHLMARLPASVQFEDLVQNGMLGLLDAMDRYQEGFRRPVRDLCHPTCARRHA